MSIPIHVVDEGSVRLPRNDGEGVGSSTLELLQVGDQALDASEEVSGECGVPN